MLPKLDVVDLMAHGAKTREALEKLYKDQTFVDHMKKLLRSLSSCGMFD